MPWNLTAVPYRPPTMKNVRLPPANPPKPRVVGPPRPEKPKAPPGYEWRQGLPELSSLVGNLACSPTATMPHDCSGHHCPRRRRDARRELARRGRTHAMPGESRTVP